MKTDQEFSFEPDYFPNGTAVWITYPNTGIPGEVGIVLGIEKDKKAMNVFTMSQRRGKKITSFEIDNDYISIVRMLPQHPSMSEMSYKEAMGQHTLDIVNYVKKTMSHETAAQSDENPEKLNQMTTMERCRWLYHKAYFDCFRKRLGCTKPEDIYDIMTHANSLRRYNDIVPAINSAISSYTGQPYSAFRQVEVWKSPNDRTEEYLSFLRDWWKMLYGEGSNDEHYT